MKYFRAQMKTKETFDFDKKCQYVTTDNLYGCVVFKESCTSDALAIIPTKNIYIIESVEEPDPVNAQ